MPACLRACVRACSLLTVMLCTGDQALAAVAAWDQQWL